MRPAIEVATQICGCAYAHQRQSDIALIEADRAEARAELVAEIVQYLQQLDATRDESNLIGWAAKRVQAEFGGTNG